MEFFYVVRATQKSGKPDAAVWFTAKSEARANLQLDVALEDAEIETGRGQDYNKPARTDFPVVNDLPEEGEVDLNWCDRYELQDDGRTWLPKVKEAQVEPEPVAETVVENGLEISQHDGENTTYGVAKMSFRKQLLAQFANDAVSHQITRAENAELSRLEMDTDNSYVQNLILTAESCDELKKLDLASLWKFTDAIKKVFAQDKRHELSLMLQFTKTWLSTEHIDRGILVREWAAGNRISAVGSQTQDDAPQTEIYKRAVSQNMANLSIEIAIALLYPEAQPGKISRPQLVGAKELADRKEDVHAKALKVIGKITDIMEYDASSIFGVTRVIPWNSAETTSELRRWAREWLATNGIYENGERSKGYPEWEDDPRASRHAQQSQPEITNVGNGIFSIDGLMAPTKQQEDISNEQMEETVHTESTPDNAVSAGESTDEAGREADPVTDVCTGCGAIGGGHCPDCGPAMGDATYAEMESDLAAEFSDDDKSKLFSSAAPNLAKAVQEEAAAHDTQEAELPAEDAAPVWPEYFEPGRYEGVPNEVYHAANGTSSTMVKDARVSLMYFDARHVSKTIKKEPSAVLDMGNLVHALALQPESLDKEFSIEPEIPEGAFTTTATIRAFIDEYNNGLPVLLSADDVKRFLEEYNATLPAQVQLGASAEETGQSYMSLPAEFQRIEDGQKQTAAAMKACIKEYNATLPAQVKTSGSRDALLEQLALINPDLVAQEAQKAQPLRVSGTKTELMQAVKSVNPDAVFADELLDAWRNNPEGKVLVTRQQLNTALAIQKALLNHPTAGKLLTHPSRAVEVSYFGFDEETGLEVRVRPDLEIDMGGLRIGADLKTISMWNVKQEGLRGRLHREIIDRDYHLSAAMYCETAALDQFFWIFVNKDENYHWIAIIEASAELLELGMLEYRKSMRAIANGFDTGHWPAPITEDYAEELNDFDVRRLEALRVQA